MNTEMIKRGILIKEEHIETLKHLPNKTIDAVLGAAFRVCLGRESMLGVKDSNGILNAIVQSIAVSAKKFDDRELAKRKNDAERKKREREAQKQALKTSSSSGRPFSSNGRPRTSTDENGQNRTSVDVRGVRTERKKEYIFISPIPPKGANEVDHAEVDLDAMMSVIDADVGEDRQEPEGEDPQEWETAPHDPTAEVQNREIDFELVEQFAATMTAAHPNKRGTDSFSRSLRRYLQKNPGARLADIAEGHAAWLRSGIWDEEGGRYAPQLARWLWGGDWKQPPPEKKAARSDTRVEDASVFHAGASL